MNAVVTLCLGKEYNKIFTLTKPSIQAYAAKIGAEFIVLDSQVVSKSTPHWEKFRLFDLLNKYQRIIYLDVDLIVRDDCPNLFEIVPEDKIGLFNEGIFTNRRGCIQSVAQELGKKVKYTDEYYNTGIMVISRKHKFLFEKPEKETDNFYEQTFLNMRIVEKEITVHSLNYKFNRMTCLDGYNGMSRLDSYIVHYAGCPNPKFMRLLIKQDLKSWKKDAPGYKYIQKLYISVSGGLGDQINSQPAIRYLKNHVLPNAEITVATHYPRIFEEMEGINVVMQGKFVAEPDTNYKVCDSFPPPSSLTYSVVGNLLCHTVDYCSIALLKRTLPLSEKNIKLGVDMADITKLIEIVGIRDLRELVLIHPGKHWESKTMPYEWWDKIMDGLIAANIPVCIIGKTGEPGVWDFKDKKGVINLIDLLDLGSLIALISQARVLVSSDSAPIHIAGAFDNWIIVIPTVKHPDHILPYRNGSVYYKTDALCKKLVLDDHSTSPFEVNEVTVDKLVDKWENYLVEPQVVIDKVIERYKK